MNERPCTLIVDDDDGVRCFLHECLLRLGHRILEAADGFEGLALLRAHPEIRLVFLDVSMPFLDGRTVLQKIKRVKPLVKVVMITGFPDEACVFTTLGAKGGADGFIAKPFTARNIETCLDLVLVRGEKYLASSPLLATLAERHRG